MLDSASIGWWFKTIHWHSLDKLINLLYVRVAFLDAISQFVDLTKTHFNKRCVSLHHTEDKSQVIVRFADGSSASADVVLGADGVRSVTRTYVTEGAEGYTTPGRFVRTSYTNTLAYRGLVPNSKVVELGMKTVMNKTPICWAGRDKVRFVSLVVVWTRLLDLMKVLAHHHLPN